MDNPTPTGGGLRAPLGSNLCRSCTRASARRYTLPARRHRVAQGREEDSRWNPDLWRRRPPGEGRCAARVGSIGEKGLKSDAISYASNIVIGVASTAPGYSLAATLGFIVPSLAWACRRRRC